MKFFVLLITLLIIGGYAAKNIVVDAMADVTNDRQAQIEAIIEG